MDQKSTGFTVFLEHRIAKLLVLLCFWDLGSKKHWRRIDETLCTFLTSKIIIEKHWNKFISMCQYEHYPFEKPLHEIYKSEYCLSPIPSLAIHCTNVNSIFGISPNFSWNRIWEENKDY